MKSRRQRRPLARGSCGAERSSDAAAKRRLEVPAKEEERAGSSTASSPESIGGRRRRRPPLSQLLTGPARLARPSPLGGLRFLEAEALPVPRGSVQAGRPGRSPVGDRAEARSTPGWVPLEAEASSRFPQDLPGRTHRSCVGRRMESELPSLPLWRVLHRSELRSRPRRVPVGPKPHQFPSAFLQSRSPRVRRTFEPSRPKPLRPSSLCARLRASSLPGAPKRSGGDSPFHPGFGSAFTQGVSAPPQRLREILPHIRFRLCWLSFVRRLPMVQTASFGGASPSAPTVSFKVSEFVSALFRPSVHAFKVSLKPSRAKRNPPVDNEDNGNN